MQRATSPDRSGIIATFCESFADDPGLSWIWPDRQDRLARLPHFFRSIVRGTMANGVALRAPGDEAVSLWRTPGRINPGRLEVLRGLPGMIKAFGSGRERAQLLSATLRPYQPADDNWWYLQFICARPLAQGKGWGGAAARAGIDLARRDGKSVYVEVMNPENLGYYRHAGFQTVAEFDIPDAGPHVWAMRSAP